MKAVRFHEYGGPLTVDEVPTPTPGPGQVLVEVAGSAFNPVDVGIRQGLFSVALPHIPGADVSGLRDGEPVFGFLPFTQDGSAAEYVLAPAELLAPAPTSIPLADAAAVPAAALTAWQGVNEHAGVTAGQRVLINGAGGGVGGFAIQFAKRLGAFVIATASPRSTSAVRALGADQIVDYTAADVASAVEPVDVVFNLVRTDEAATAALVGLVRPGGVIVSATSPSPAREGVRTVQMGVESRADELAEISRLIDAGEIKVDVYERHPLADLEKVYERGAAGDLRGRVVITPR
ncbi:NADP-dependent oxidoreductase [Actinoplanes sp. NPDC051633]|uniref:NADP-dependent oxidoreductase n=1 Tax=Actinoplanes sp. NPDC051633 TaxID=3155670 RepID=UPI003440103F